MVRHKPTSITVNRSVKAQLERYKQDSESWNEALRRLVGSSEVENHPNGQVTDQEDSQ